MVHEKQVHNVRGPMLGSKFVTLLKSIVCTIKARYSAPCTTLPNQHAPSSESSPCFYENSRVFYKDEKIISFSSPMRVAGEHRTSRWALLIH